MTAVCANLDCAAPATHRLTYTGHEYALCHHHADTGMEWLAANRPALASTAVMTPLATPVVDRPPLFELETP